MKKFIDYDKATGLINRVVTFWSEALGKEIYPDCLVVDGHEEVSDVKHFVRDGKVFLRPEMQLRFYSGRVYGLPVPSVINVEGRRYEVEGPDVELEFLLPGRYQVSVESWPYINYVYEVDNDQD